MWQIFQFLTIHITFFFRFSANPTRTSPHRANSLQANP